MSSDEARLQLHAAVDGELAGEELARFERALRDDPALRAEYDALRGLAEETRKLALTTPGPSVDLLAGVQQRLRERSGGRFYRDRFAERSGLSSAARWMVGLALLTIAAAGVWFVLSMPRDPRRPADPAGLDQARPPE